MSSWFIFPSIINDLVPEVEASDNVLSTESRRVRTQIKAFGFTCKYVPELKQVRVFTVNEDGRLEMDRLLTPRQEQAVCIKLFQMIET